MGIPKNVAITKGKNRKYDFAMEIMEQIEICEDMRTPLSYEDLDKLCAMQNMIAIDNYCKAVKRRIA